MYLSYENMFVCLQLWQNYIKAAYKIIKRKLFLTFMPVVPTNNHYISDIKVMSKLWLEYN